MATKKEPAQGITAKRAEEDVEGHKKLLRTPEATAKRAAEDVEGHSIAKKIVHRATEGDDVEGHGVLKRWPAEGVTSHREPGD